MLWIVNHAANAAIHCGQRGNVQRRNHGERKQSDRERAKSVDRSVQVFLSGEVGEVPHRTFTMSPARSLQADSWPACRDDLLLYEKRDVECLGERRPALKIRTRRNMYAGCIWREDDIARDHWRVNARAVCAQRWIAVRCQRMGMAIEAAASQRAEAVGRGTRGRSAAMMLAGPAATRRSLRLCLHHGHT